MYVRIDASYLASAAFFASQRLLTASAMRFRPSGLRFLFFLAGFAAFTFLGAAVDDFCAAQRFLTASAILFRPSGESFLFFFFAGF